MSRRTFVKVAGAAVGALALGNLRFIHPAYGSVQVLQIPLRGNKIPQFVDPLPHFAGQRIGTSSLNINMVPHSQQVLSTGTALAGGIVGPGAGLTKLWAYSINNIVNYPAVTIEATRGTPTTVTYSNNLTNSLYSLLTVDQSLHWANPQNNPSMITNPNPPPPAMIGNPAFYTGPVPAVVHLHGGEVPPQFDGGPDAWWTPGAETNPALPRGHAFITNTYTYPNSQEGTTLWFHDHALGVTRLNVYAGLAGFYFLRDTADELDNLPGGPSDTNVVDNSNPAAPRTIKPEIEIVIQDRQFDTNGQLFFPDGSNDGLLGPPPNPLDHPYWIPEFTGDAIVVNGKTWPFLNVEPRRYRFRLLNGSNARAYELFLLDRVTGIKGPAIWVIGTDGGLLDLPVMIDPNIKPNDKLVMMPGERYDVIIDFTHHAGITLEVRNTAKTPYPGGAPVQGSTTGRIMQFRVGTALTGGPDNSYDPASRLSPRKPGKSIIRLANSGVMVAPKQKTRRLTLNEVIGAGGPLEVLVNNTMYNGINPNGSIRSDFQQIQVNGVTTYYSELPQEGDTEEWEIINLTADAHPIHLHLVQFQLINRQNLDVKKYTAAYAAAFPGGGLDPATGLPYPLGVYMPAYGPPLNYNSGTPGVLGGNPAPILKGAAIPPLPQEEGWKDTVIMFPGQVTRIAVRYAPTDKALDASDLWYPFNPDGGHGYVWHCHIIDHEDNEMMRPKSVQPNLNAPLDR